MLEAARTYASPFCWRVSAVCCRLGLTGFTLVPLAEETMVQGRRGRRQRQQRRPKNSLPQLCLGILEHGKQPSTINNQREFQIFQIRESHSNNFALPVLFCHVKHQWLGMAYCQVLANLCTLLVGKETATLLERSQSPEPVREEGPWRDCERTPKLRSFFWNKLSIYVVQKRDFEAFYVWTCFVFKCFHFYWGSWKVHKTYSSKLAGPSSLVQ